MIKELKEELLDKMYKEYLELGVDFEEGNNVDKFSFLSSTIFDLTTYDPEIDIRFGKVIYKVCDAIYYGETYKYLEKNDTNYMCYIIVCNLLISKYECLDWGSSIRGAFFVDSDKPMFSLLYMPADEEEYDPDGVECSVDNIRVLLEWCSRG